MSIENALNVLLTHTKDSVAGGQVNGALDVLGGWI